MVFRGIGAQPCFFSPLFEGHTQSVLRSAQVGIEQPSTGELDRVSLMVCHGACFLSYGYFFTNLAVRS